MCADLPRGNYTVISPYLLPPGSPKKVNIGDGFILDSCVKLIGAAPSAVFSSRTPLSDFNLEQINAGRFVIAAGANTLKDDFELTTGFTLETLKRIKVPVILFGVGHYGVEAVTQGMTPASRTLFAAMIERFPYISVRCDASRQYLVRSLPEYADHILMTSCPVVYPVDGIDDGFQRKSRYQQLVVTLTERTNLQAQLPILTAARQLFPAERAIYALHQDYGNEQLCDYARQQGYELFRSQNCQDFIELYKQSDIHFGNRLHAHLKCLSLGKVSFLTPFDLRQAYFAQSLDFPLITALPDPSLQGYDFSRAVQRRNLAKRQLDVFLAATQSLLAMERA
ncbi:MAG TPA: polysaccharide pyruvyl transferase family protein [Terriglobia bacterium]|nr:polysaccharide pyruvyl transferase family protein [Terriglobia bacterium]